MFNAREGLSSKDDYLPDRLFEPLEQGTERERQITREDFAKALKLYYQAMGWDPESRKPTRETVEKLGLTNLVGE